MLEDIIKKTQPESESKVDSLVFNCSKKGIRIVSNGLIEIDYFNAYYEAIETKLNISKFEQTKNAAYDFFCSLKSQFKKGTKYSSIVNLTPVSLYLYFAAIETSLSVVEYVKKLNLDKKEFLRDLLVVGRCCQKYLKRDKKAIVEKKLFTVRKEFNLSVNFELTAVLILNCFWDELSCTKESVVAATIGALTLVYLNVKKPTINKICTLLSVKMSAVIYQFKHKIFAKKIGCEFSTIKTNKADIIKIISQKIQQ